MELTIECKARDSKANVKALRRQGLLPAVLYGHNGTEAVSLTVDQKAAETLLRQATVNTTVIDLQVPDLPWHGKALVRDVQTHPWKSSLYHLSFFAVKA
jgi:large subunit ribosomal protein L25